MSDDVVKQLYAEAEGIQGFATDVEKVFRDAAFIIGTQAAEIARLRAAINDALTAPFPDPVLNSTWHQEPIGPNETPEEAIKRLVSVRAEWEVHKNNCENPVIAELRAELTRLRVALKWHIERDGDDLLICEGDHDRHEGCIMQRWVKAENVATARRDAMEEAAVLLEQIAVKEINGEYQSRTPRCVVTLSDGISKIRAALEGGKS